MAFEQLAHGNSLRPIIKLFETYQKSTDNIIIDGLLIPMMAAGDCVSNATHKYRC
jgi:hypothetical protein|tara:strand:+ start:2078 stop:2242 length:165 start_codon:yes stop_codon:yes gene_type:complete